MIMVIFFGDKLENEMSYDFVLTAVNRQGSIIKIYGESQKECLEKFDAQYSRKGWIINIFDALNESCSTIKKTYK